MVMHSCSCNPVEAHKMKLIIALLLAARAHGFAPAGFSRAAPATARYAEVDEYGRAYCHNFARGTCTDPNCRRSHMAKPTAAMKKKLLEADTARAARNAANTGDQPAAEPKAKAQAKVKH